MKRHEKLLSLLERCWSGSIRILLLCDLFWGPWVVPCVFYCLYVMKCRFWFGLKIKNGNFLRSNDLWGLWLKGDWRYDSLNAHEVWYRGASIRWVIMCRLANLCWGEFLSTCWIRSKLARGESKFSRAIEKLNIFHHWNTVELTWVHSEVYRTNSALWRLLPMNY